MLFPQLVRVRVIVILIVIPAPLHLKRTRALTVMGRGARDEGRGFLLSAVFCHPGMRGRGEQPLFRPSSPLFHGNSAAIRAVLGLFPLSPHSIFPQDMV